MMRVEWEMINEEVCLEATIGAEQMNKRRQAVFDFLN